MTYIDINDNNFKRLIGIDDAVSIYDKYPELEDTVEFNRMVLAVASDMVATLLEKNEKYKGAYRKVRQYCKERYGDPGIPYAVHSFEKQLRIDADGDTEDARLDHVNYGMLEYVCWKLDDQPVPANRVDPDSEQKGPSCGDAGHWHQNKDGSWDRVTDYGAVLEHSDIPEIPTVTAPPTIDLLVPLDEPEPMHIRVCIECGQPLVGRQELYCSKQCANRSRYHRGSELK